MKHGYQTALRHGAVYFETCCLTGENVGLALQVLGFDRHCSNTSTVVVVVVRSSI